MILPKSLTADWAEAESKHPRFAQLIKQMGDLDPLPTAVVHPTDRDSLLGALAAAEDDTITPILVGPRQKIEAAAAEAHVDLEKMEIVDAAYSHDAANKAVALAHDGKVKALMKGSLHSDELLHAAMSRDRGLRTERRISHIFIMDVPSYHKLLAITDAAVNITPSLDDKRSMTQNAIDMMRAIGVERPKVAILSAVEVVTGKMPSTLDAAALCKMADRGQITGGLLDGPLAFDNAISSDAAKTKHIVSEVAGDPDILVTPDIDAGNMLSKQLTFLSGAVAAGIVLGARVPIMLTSRADPVLARRASAAAAVAAAVAGAGTGK
ncbi:MAG: bifunctional enoyl-CoA hydratase/phosphate acetyltransferase [Pseudomonadota bacterium]